MWTYLKMAGMVLSLLAAAGCTLPQEAGKSPGGIAAARAKVERSLQELAESIEPQKQYPPQERFARLEAFLQKNEVLFGAAWAVPGRGDTADVFYLYNDGSTFVKRTEPGVDVRDPALAWYRNAKRDGSGGWSQAYQVVDDLENRLTLITYSQPVKSAAGVTAVVACDYLIKKEPPAKKEPVR